MPLSRRIRKNFLTNRSSTKQSLTNYLHSKKMMQVINLESKCQLFAAHGYVLQFLHPDHRSIGLDKEPCSALVDHIHEEKCNR
jgi:hypothetical protein